MPATGWVLLVYKIPREPTAARVYAWRKLQQLGAIALQDAVWVLPATRRTQEQFQWLATEISELGGEARLWVSDLVFEDGAEDLQGQFVAKVEQGYREIISELKRKGRDLSALSRRYQQVLAQDYFQCRLGQAVRKQLLEARGENGP